MTESPRDHIYAEQLQNVGDFRFDDAVADVFGDMISRSVPGYGSILAMLPTLAKRFAIDHTAIYDLGCSLGAVSMAVAPHVPSGCTIHAIDNSPAMLDRFRHRLGNEDSALHRNIKLSSGDVRQVCFEPASMVVANFTLQFLSPVDRGPLIVRIAEALVDGGVFVLSEKIALNDPDEQSLLTALHHEFKSSNGYSDLEIAQKRDALENTLIPETLVTHEHRLRAAGFDVVVPWIQCLGFASIVAVKRCSR